MSKPRSTPHDPSRIVREPRIRTRGLQKPTVLTWDIRETTPPNPTVTGGGTVQVGCQAGTYGYVNDIVWRPFRKSGSFSDWKPTQPFSAGSLEVIPSSGSKTTSYTPFSDGRVGVRTWAGDGVGYLFGPLCPQAQTLSFGTYPDLVNGQNLANLAVIECLNRINPALSQSLIVAHEARKTVDMIYDRAKKLAATYSALRKGNIRLLDRLYPGKRTFSYPKSLVVWDDNGQPIVSKRTGKTVKRYARVMLPSKDISNLTAAARLELEFRYGWTPLVHDIVDGLKAVFAPQLRAELTPRDFTTVWSRKVGSNASTQRVTVTQDGGSFVAEVAFSHREEVKAYAKYRVTQPDGFTNRLHEFGIFDIPRSLWDAVPLSFVFDWIIPVGDWLGAATPRVGVEVIDSGVVRRTEKSVHRTLVGYTPSSSGPGAWPESPFPIGAQDSFLAVGKNRSPGLPIPLLPPIEINLNLKRLADAAALLRVMR